ncbi:MAG TPA: GNAT family N-acetyltransferase [Patescibacteria group bacterium]
MAKEKQFELEENPKLSPVILNNLFESIGWSTRDDDKWLEVQDKTSYFVAKWDKNRLIGMGRIVEDGVMCMIYDVCVRPQYQSQGVGTSIMERIVDQVRDKGYASIGLFVWEGNLKAAEFYKRFGFEKVGTGMELVALMQRE